MPALPQMPTVSGIVLVMLGLASVSWAAGDPRFGVMTHFAQGWDPDWVDLVAQASIGSVRDELYWQSVEPRKGVYEFPAAYERYMAALKRKDISPLIVLSFENRAYDGGQTPYTPDAFSAYARYAVEVLRHYGAQIKAVEIWNEYNGSFCHGPATKDRTGTYLKMLRAAYLAIKRERPDVTVLGGATSGVPLPYWRKLIEGGGLDYMDALSVHPYCYSLPPEGLEANLEALQSLVASHRGGKLLPLWVTETGWFLKASKAPGDLAIDEATQAKFLVRADALFLSAGVGRVYWYLLHDDRGLAMGLIRNDPARTPRISYRALATLINELRDARFVGRDPAPQDLYSFVFEQPSGRKIRIVWSLRPRSMGTRGITAAADLQGKPVALGATLALDDSPLYLEGEPADLPAPGPAGKVLADSARQFSGQQGGSQWSYGTFTGDRTDFAALPSYAATDWTEMWSGRFPYVSITAADQHPSVAGRQVPVSAVRRWTSKLDATVRIRGSFRSGTQGDGVGVSILVDGRRRFRTLIGGDTGRAVTAPFDFVLAVHPGTAVDFAVDPGPAANIDYDVTAVAVTISEETSHG